MPAVTVAESAAPVIGEARPIRDGDKKSWPACAPWVDKFQAWRLDGRNIIEIVMLGEA